MSARRLGSDNGDGKARGAADATSDPAGKGSGKGQTNPGRQRTAGFCDKDLVAGFLRRDARDDIALLTPLKACSGLNAACCDG